MKQITSKIKQSSLIISILITMLGLTAAPAAAVTKTTTDSPTVKATTDSTSAKATASATADQTKIKTIITRGDAEITRRLTTLATLETKFSSAAKLNASDKSTLTSEVSDEVSGLKTLKAKLDADTDLATTKTDAQSIVSGYRVYALIVPKVELVKTADDQQVTEAKLTALAAKLQTRLTTAQTAGKNVASLQTSLTDLTTKTSTAQTISAGIESSVISLQPTDYDSNHSILSGDRTQLKTVQTDIQAAITDAKTIVSGVKNL
jgi:hypothetical protein